MADNKDKLTVQIGVAVDKQKLNSAFDELATLVKGQSSKPIDAMAKAMAQAVPKALDTSKLASAAVPSKPDLYTVEPQKEFVGPVKPPTNPIVKGLTEFASIATQTTIVITAMKEVMTATLLPITAVSAGLQSLQGSLGPIGAGIDLLKGAAEHLKMGGELVGGAIGELVGGPAGAAIGAAIGALLGDSLGKVLGSLQDSLNSVVSLAGKANPAALALWEQTLNDIMATVGYRVVPILQLMTESARWMGNALAGLLPSTSQVAGIISQLNPVIDNLKKHLLDIGPLIQQGFITALKVVVKTIETLLAATDILAKGLRPLQWTLEKTGIIEKGKKPGLGETFNAAGRTASFGSNFESIQETATIAALQVGKDWDKQTADNTREMVKLMAAWERRNDRESHALDRDPFEIA